MAQATGLKKGDMLQQEIPIPENIQADVSGDAITVRGEKGELKRMFSYPYLKIEKTGGKIVFKVPFFSKKEKAVIGSFAAHINNMFRGVTKGFRYRLKVVFSHFPMTAKVVKDHIEIANFLGEKTPRIARIRGTVKVTAGKDEITIEGINKEEVAQTAANLEQITKIRYKDTRVFQDGIYIVGKE